MTSTGQVDTLPRGRHSLTREQITGQQRERLLRAAIDEAGERGYGSMSAASIYGRARVSSRTFYEHFTDKEDCFLAAYDEAAGWFVGAVRTAWTDGCSRDSAYDRFDLLVDSYLKVLAEHRNFARAATVEIYAVGAAALDRRLAVQFGFVGLTEEAFGWNRATPEDHFAVQTLIGGIAFMVGAKVAAGEYDGLMALRAPIAAVTIRLLAH